VLTLGRRLGIGAALLGPTPGITTVVLGQHGDVTAVQPEQALPALPGAQVFTLSAAEARELLTVIAAGRGVADEEPSDPVSDTQAGSHPQADGANAFADTQVAADRRPIGVDLFGPLRIHTHGGEVRTGLRRKARELLAFLLLHPEGVTRDTVIEALWPEIDPARGAERAKTAIQNLRHTLRAAAGLDGATVIEWAGERWRVNAALVDCDVWRFQAALAAASAAPDDPAKTAALERATAAYHGSLLEGADYDWAEPAREELRRQAADAAGRLAELRERASDGDGALTALEAAAGWDPYNEELHQRIMRLQARLGRPDAVRRTFDRLQTRLAELDVDPDDATEHLLAELLRPAGTPPQRR
jgi:DNA-binding SARP family transcriptional activator